MIDTEDTFDNEDASDTADPSDTGDTTASDLDTERADRVADLVEHVARALVDEPDRVEISIDDGVDETHLELHVAPDDLGKVIGRGGRTARAIRALLTAAGVRDRHRYALEIVD